MSEKRLGPDGPRRPALVSSRLVLLVGFGGLLVLMGYAEFDGLRVQRRIQATDDGIREGFVARTRVLERIRASVYVSGTFVRDYLLEPEVAKAESSRERLLESRRAMEAALQEYRALLTPEETKPFESLTRELSAYWDVLEPVFAWTPEQRRRDGYVFLRDQVFPRRVSMLGIADQIGAIAESDLDQGRRRAEATFSRFRARLAVTVGLTLGLGLLLAAFSIRQILGLEKEAEARYQEIASARAELEHLSGRLVQVQEDERRSLSRDLHDEVGQALTGVLLEMANLSTLIRTRDLEALAAKTDEIKKLLEGAIGVVRNMALLLRPSMLDDLGLLPALQWQAREVSRRTGLRVQVAAEGVAEDLPEEVRTCVYRVVQEALHNCVRHAAAQTVRVTLSTEGGALGLSIHDDGRGFDSLRSRGLGLVGLEERVRRLGGTFSVDSKPGRGTVLLVSLPLSPMPGPPGL